MKNGEYLPRHLSGKIQEAFGHFPVVVLSGARQVGKSTLLANLYPDLPRVAFEPLRDIENARADPELFLRHRQAPVILDEIQYAKELVPVLKARLERDRRPGQYLATGSQRWQVMKVLAESLAGRAVFCDLDSLSLAEISRHDVADLWLPAWLADPGTVVIKRVATVNPRTAPFDRLWRGFLPEVVGLPQSQVPIFHQAYERTYVQRDVRELANVRDVQLFARFFRLCMALCAQEINYSQLGREIGVSNHTANEWLAIMRGTFQWFEVPAFSRNMLKRLSGRPKGYAADSGAICAALAVGAPEAVASHPTMGSLFETAVAMELRKQMQTMATQPNLFHWRTHSGAEVDLIIEYSGKLYPIEIKSKSRPSGRDTRGLRAFREAYRGPEEVTAGLIIAPAEEAYPVSEHDWVIPWDATLMPPNQ